MFKLSISANWHSSLCTTVETTFTRENLVLFERHSRKACTVANGRYTCSLIWDFTYLGITLSDQLSLPIFYVSLWNLSSLLTIYQSWLLANFIKIESRKMLIFYIHTNGAFLKSLSVNDLPSSISKGSEVFLFADDTKIYREIMNNDDCENLQEDI